jgi:hypothetical protein
VLLKRSNETGSILALVPAAVLVLLLLTALVLDAAATFLAQQELADACAAAANDAGTVGLTDDSLYAGDGAALVIDLDVATRLAADRVRDLGVRWGHVVEVDVTNGSDRSVLHLRLRGTAPLPIGAGAGPAARRTASVQATCQVTARRR